MILYAAQKGGVGKTLFSVQGCLIAAVHKRAKVLLIDVDPQKNSSSTFCDPEMLAVNTDCYSSLLFTEEPELTPLKGMHGIDVIPGDDGINSFPQDLTNDAFAELIERVAGSKIGDINANDIIADVVDRQLVSFAKNIKQLKKQYDYIFIDTPPSFLGLPLISGLCAATDVVCLVEPNKYSGDVIENFISKVNEIHEKYNDELKFHGFMINRFRGNSNRQKERVQLWMKEYGEHFIGEPIKINSWLEDSTEDGEPVWVNANNANRKAGAYSLLSNFFIVFPELKE
ncbi:chromosome partitioning protein ParA [Thalassotalea marina]|uniref:Chromosome partitioning protein ParA n=1 Tax=Thalassotalea marina TaxID=1673741 RepID=A0A919EQA3_9GAMM|nr:chromosome partitioning protein ParA [Thalassotalea marina]